MHIFNITNFCSLYQSIFFEFGIVLDFYFIITALSKLGDVRSF